jgi:hypothetical protein
MTLFAQPDTVACPQCDWYFARRVLRSYSPFLRIVYSDGGAKNSIETYIPTVGRCPSCNLVIKNINDLTPISDASSHSWIEKLWSKLSGKDLAFEYDYLNNPTFSDYAELFDIANTTTSKRNWAVLACRAYHQAYFLPADDADNDDQSINKNNTPSKAFTVRYFDISGFVLGNAMRPASNEYTLLCADIYRLRGDFSAAILEYDKVKDPHFDHIVEQGYKWCVERNARLMELRLQ